MYSMLNISLICFQRGSAKPLTVREELAKWRQDLQEESRQRTINTRSAASTPNLSLSSNDHHSLI